MSHTWGGCGGGVMLGWGVLRSFLSDAAKRHKRRIDDENTDPLRAKLAPVRRDGSRSGFVDDGSILRTIFMSDEA